AHPLGVYGQSKFEGEQAVLEVMPEAVIVRTAWVYGIHGHNFVKTILKLAAEREELTVVDDQIGTPSWTADIAKAIYALINISAKGIYHFTNEGVASWYDFAQQVVITAQNLGFSVKAKRICPIPTNDFPTLAKRPEYSVLSKGKIRPILDHDIPHWQQSLEDMLKQLQNSQRVST
ncbi:MAG: sugar nucleotide-binding protein, partial [Gammaproteobacteria bacterium]|nr:sugar nucleotide-binding protein [Gammaproteobacteria bacterium]